MLTVVDSQFHDVAKLPNPSSLIATTVARHLRSDAVTAFHPGANETMQIYGPFRLSTTQATSSASQVSGPSAGKPSRINSAETTPSKPTQVDQLDLSSAAQVSTSTATNRVDAIAGGGEIRVDRVADIRRQIADGTYETPEKLDAALDRFLDELA